MDKKRALQPQMTVEEVLTNWPGVHEVFMKWKTNCVGCYLQRFCTLQDVSETYRIPLPDLLGDLGKYIQNKYQI